MSFGEAVWPATIVCREPLKFEFDETTQMFLARDPALNVVRAFTPAAMHQNIASGARCYAEWRKRQTGEVIEFPGRKAIG